MAKTWRAGVIGCGKMAQVAHLTGYLKCPGVELAAACDPDPRRLTEARRIYSGLTVYRDYREMLEAERLDVVSVVSPNSFHAEHAEASLRHGAHVLLEKPPVLSMKEIAQVRSAAKKSKRQVIVGFSHRFMRGNRKIRKMLADGAIGEPLMIRVRFAHSGPYAGWAKSDWFYDPKRAGGGALLDMGIHAIDQALWQIGPVGRVRAVATTLRKDIRVDDSAVLLLEFANGRALGYI
ncbi:MAG TPA: Gfo/Idh/MocA family oxidoreductase, partial [Phycisphaerae bacterium]|nr:Gfo/Idh/MocA family oxidoreductase [Phycisphaerae bacterium]